MIAAKKYLLAEEVNLPEAKGEVIFSKITLPNSHPSINKYSLTVLHEAIKILYSHSFLFEWCGTDEGTNGVTMPAHSCKTASGGVWLREDMS